MMALEDTDTVVIGAGQAGIAASEHLSSLSIPHVVLERDQIASSWHTRRWDSLVANGPAWHDRFPNLEFDLDNDAFATKNEVADYFASYAKTFNAPIRTGVDVIEVSRLSGSSGFRVKTNCGHLHANHVVVATGAFHTPVIPSIAPDDKHLQQIHSTDYKNPSQLPGSVFVIGSGSSGAQIAEELCSAGRSVYLSVGPHNRPPRSYRNRDYCWWLGVLGEWDVTTPALGTEHVTIAVSGANGGHTVDFRELSNSGIRLLGMTESFKEGVVSIAPDLKKNIEDGDANYLAVLRSADAYINRNGLDLPEEPDAYTLLPDPPCVEHPVRSLDLKAAGIESIVWATGYAQDFSWLKVDVFDETGRPNHQRGVAAEPGVYFLGLPWLSRRGSSFIWGVWHDALYVANHIATKRSYSAYHDGAARSESALTG